MLWSVGTRELAFRSPSGERGADGRSSGTSGKPCEQRPVLPRAGAARLQPPTRREGPGARSRAGGRQPGSWAHAVPPGLLCRDRSPTSANLSLRSGLDPQGPLGPCPGLQEGARRTPASCALPRGAAGGQMEGFGRNPGSSLPRLLFPQRGPRALQVTPTPDQPGGPCLRVDAVPIPQPATPGLKMATAGLQIQAGQDQDLSPPPRPRTQA